MARNPLPPDSETLPGDLRLGSGAANQKVMAYFFHEQRQTEAREEEA
jgi:hypothetical protein